MRKRLNESATRRLGKRLAEGVLREMNEGQEWRNNHVRPNSPEFENWAAQALAQGASPGYIDHWRQLDSWTGGGAERNGLVDFSSGQPMLRQDALAEFQNGDNHWFKRNNARERQEWLDRHLAGIGNEESYWWPRTVRGGYPPYGGGYPQQPQYPSNGGGNDQLMNMLIMSEIMKAVQTGRNEAAAHPDMAAGAPQFPMWIWTMLMNNGSGGRMMPPMGGGMPPMGGGMPPMGGGMPPMGGGMPPMGGGMPPMGGGMPPMGGGMPPMGGMRPLGVGSR